MKKFFSKWPLLVLLAAVTVSFAFVSAQKAKKETTYYYKYIGSSTAPETDLSPYQNPSNWVESTELESGCGGGLLPCKVAVMQDNKTDFVNSIADENDVRDFEIESRN
jgi:hypothetical protein